MVDELQTTGGVMNSDLITCERCGNKWEWGNRCMCYTRRENELLDIIYTHYPNEQFQEALKELNEYRSEKKYKLWSAKK